MINADKPQPSLEQIAMERLGYGDCLDTPVTLGGMAVAGNVVGRNFLAAYGDSPHRQQTEDLLAAFADMAPDDPDYDFMATHISRYLKVQFGPRPEEA